MGAHAGSINTALESCVSMRMNMDTHRQGKSAAYFQAGRLTQHSTVLGPGCAGMWRGSWCPPPPAHNAAVSPSRVNMQKQVHPAACFTKFFSSLAGK